MASHPIDVPLVEIDDWRGVPQRLLRGKGIIEERDREGIDVQMRNDGRTADGTGVFRRRRAGCTHSVLRNFDLVRPALGRSHVAGQPFSGSFSKYDKRVTRGMHAKVG